MALTQNSGEGENSASFRRVAAAEFSPAFQGRDKTFDRFFVALATSADRFKRR